jgi:Ribonuclease G/E
VIDELEMPDGMSLIIRTAGAQRPKPEIRRDCEYLLSCGTASASARWPAPRQR